jgi:hypothetical protein
MSAPVYLDNYRLRRRPPAEPPADKVRNGFILLYGDDVPDELVDRISGMVGVALKDEPTEFMVSGADADCYDYFDAECE